MDVIALRRELHAFYLNADAQRAQSFARRCFDLMDQQAVPDMTVIQQKLLQYQVICQEFEPVIFPHSPYFFETGVLTSLSDGARVAKGHKFLQANGWVYQRNVHRFRDQDPDLHDRRMAQTSELLYLIPGGPYNDVSQHFNFNNRPFLEEGMQGVYRRAQLQLEQTQDPQEREFLEAVCQGMLTMRRMAEKFADRADALLEHETDPECRANLTRISHTARRIPWEPPRTLYEGLAALAFLRTVPGSLEGIGLNTFGRVDRDLIPLYRADLERGMTQQEAYDLIRGFLLVWDRHYDHDMKMEGYADHELENTYTLGGCDRDGAPLYNELTSLFLRAAREDRIIFPKIKCRYSAQSPREYLDEIDRAVVDGTSTVLFSNDDAAISALVRAGRPLEEARDYYVAGCWGMVTAQEKYDHGCYLNLLKPFEFSLHRLTDKMDKVGIRFAPMDECRSFEELYRTVVENSSRLIEARLDITRRGGQIFHQVDRFPIFSSSIDGCIEKRADFTMGGAKYRDDYLLMFGLPNLVDSMLAIKTLVFDRKKYSLSQYLDAVRANWEGQEAMRQEAILCPGWGDGSDESCALARRFNDDLFALCREQTGTYGGRVNMGHLTYTEIRFWGERTLATPDGRKNGDYFAQGLTPSRLKRIPCVNDVIRSMAALDPSTLAAGSVVNVILPPAIPLDRCAGFLKATASTAVQSLQLNCTSKEQLLDAQKHPERYPDLIVRVTGFSAKFTSLSPQWQDEVLTRNFYE